MGFFPGLNKAIEINCESLPADEALQVEHMIGESNFFELPEPTLEPSRGADRKEYIIKVEDQSRHHMIKVTETEANPGLQNLLKYLNNKQKGMRGES